MTYLSKSPSLMRRVIPGIGRPETPILGILSTPQSEVKQVIWVKCLALGPFQLLHHHQMRLSPVLCFVPHGSLAGLWEVLRASPLSHRLFPLSTMSSAFTQVQVSAGTFGRPAPTAAGLSGAA